MRTFSKQTCKMGERECLITWLIKLDKLHRKLQLIIEGVQNKSIGRKLLYKSFTGKILSEGSYGRKQASIKNVLD